MLSQNPMSNVPCRRSEGDELSAEAMREQAETDAMLEAERPLNYFNYFTEVEDAFIRRRGKHLHLCSLDWNLIEVWKDRGVPLHIVLRGIERWFDFYEQKRRRRSVNMLMYCQEEVEAQYAEWLESHVGAETSGHLEVAVAGSADQGLPFPRQTILEHLLRGRTALLETLGERKRTREDDFTDALTRAAGLLEALADDFKHSATADAQKLEVSLTGLERMLSDAIRAVVPADRLERLNGEVEEQLRPYRKHMEAPVYAQTFDNLSLKRLREEFAVPRLSLFYL